MNQIDLSGQTAVVTGGAQGIGFAIARRLLASGARVSLWDLNTDALAAATSALGEGSFAKQVDITDLEGLKRVHAETEAELGPVSILVNSAGIAGNNATLEDYDPDEWRRVVEINLNGTFYVNKVVIPSMKAKNYGRIVNISSVAGISGPPVMSAYAASKFALEGMSESLQCEVGRHGIRVFIIRPGVILTPIWAKSEVLATEAYQDQSDAMVHIIGWGLGNEAVGPEVVADAIADAVSAETHVVRHVVGNADRIARMREELSDEDLLGVWGLDEAAFRDRYSELAGADYWG